MVGSGTYDILVGASATDIRRTATLSVKGETIPPRGLRAPVAAWTFDDYSGTTLVPCTSSSPAPRGSTP
ncbi:hypothetical protein [Phytohabitans kaempferiae]|uniref:Uncharacterized protein n=1 Tax=Phytohabitans kaempferiae TaxID=1620943 RepID=A0ABV6MG71_9ACTN